MIPGVLSVSDLPLAWPPADWDVGVSDPFRALLSAGGLPETNILIATPLDPTAAGSLQALPGPTATLPLAFSPSLTVIGAEVAVRMSDTGYIASGLDMPPHAKYPAVLETAYNITVSLSATNDDPLPSLAEVTASDITIANGGGDYDHLLGLSWVGREMEIRAGLWSWRASSFARIMRGVVTSIRSDDEAIHLGFRPRLAVLDQMVERRRYGGSGGAEGPATLKDTLIPLVVGRRRSVPLTLLDKATQIHRVAERLGAVLGVRDRGVPFDASSGDYPSYAALAAATIAPGAWASCLGLGLIRFGSEVSDPICDVDGDPDAGLSAPAIIAWLLSTRLPPSLRLGAADIDAGALARAATARPWVVGVRLTDDQTVSAVVGLLARSIGAWGASTRDGMFTLGLYGVVTPPEVTITDAEVDDEGPTLESCQTGAARVRVGYRPRDKVLSDDDMPAADAATKADLGAALKYVWADRAVADRGVKTATIETVLDTETDARELAGALSPMLATATSRWTIPLRGDGGRGFRYRLGGVVALRYPRHGLSVGASFQVVSLTEDSDGDNALAVIGPLEV